MSGQAARAAGGAVQTPVQRPQDFARSAVKLIKRIAPQRGLTTLVVLLGTGGIVIGVAGPRILGHATDLLFNGIIGRRLPAGISKEQAIEAARSRGDSTFADMLSGMSVVPGQGVAFGAVAGTLALALALYLVAALLVWLQYRILNVAVQRTMVALRADVEEKMHRLSLSYFDSRSRGDILSRVTNDMDNVQNSLSMAIGQMVTSMLTVVAVAGMMVAISPLLALITAVSLPLSLIVIRAISRRSHVLFGSQWRNTGRLNAHIEETLSGFTEVQMYGRRAHAQGRFRDLNDDVYEVSFAAQCLAGLASPATTFIGNLSYVGVAVVGGLQVATGQITLGSVQAFIMYVRRFNQPVTQVASMYTTMQSGVASAERIFDLLDTEEDETEGTHDGYSAAPPTGSTTAAGRVEFDRVNFGYGPSTPVIKNVSFVAERGSTVAIVGTTGAGKTTLVNLLLRFYEVDSGRILIDGVDIANVDKGFVRSKFGIVLQDTWLFDGTIYDNIAYGCPNAGEEEVIGAAKAAYVDRFVRNLPEGYQTWVSDDGGTISAGEKQLVTIARAYLARSPLLVLDEATSSVDTRTELLLQQAMNALSRDRTSFVIAHRLSTVRHADLILVMNAGTIVERGTHTQLMSERGQYFDMVHSNLYPSG